MTRPVYAMVILGALGLVGVAPLLAQETGGAPAPADQALDGLRTRAPSAADNEVIDNWIKGELDTLRKETSDPGAAAGRFVTALRAQYSNPQNQEQFKTRLAERAGSLFQQEYARGADLNAQVARALARTLAEFGTVTTREALLAGLSFPDQTVRYLSARTLSAIRSQVEVDDLATRNIIPAIAEVGKKERSGVVAAEVYAALGYKQRNLANAVKGVVTVLEGRLAILREPNAQLDRAELVALRFLDSAEIGNEDKVKVVQALAVLLRLGVTRYAATDLTAYERVAIQEIIFEGEALLTKLVAPTGDVPNVRERMQTDDALAATNMAIDLNQWIGPADGSSKGLLGAAPWNVPQGAP